MVTLDDIGIQLTVIQQKLDDVGRKLTVTDLKENVLMAQIDDLRQSESDLRQAIADTAKRVQANIDALEAKVANTPVGPDLAPTIQAMREDATALQSIGAAAPTTP